MPREGTKTQDWCTYSVFHYGIEIRYAPGGDENLTKVSKSILNCIEIRYAPGGDENHYSYQTLILY